jgi:uncharacterized protein with HEPN domain
MREYRLYLNDILAAIDSIELFVAGMDLEAFQADDKTTSAVIRKFEIIGEAAKNVPAHIRTSRKSLQIWKPPKHSRTIIRKIPATVTVAAG